MIDPHLTAKTALITGANHGIGAATARALAAQGVAVFLTYLRYPAGPPNATGEGDTLTPGRAFYRQHQAQSADAVVAAIRAQGGRAAAWEADLAGPAAIPDIFARAESALGPVDILVNNAAYCESDTFLPPAAIAPGRTTASGMRMSALDVATLDRHFAVNSRATALLIAEYARRHVERGAAWGRIINVSTDGAACFPGEISYGASKHALESYARAAAVELGPFGITVNTVSLGAVQTGWISAEIEQRTAREYPLRRIGRPDDVAGVIVFPASHQARWLTGQLIYVGGGHIMPL